MRTDDLVKRVEYYDHCVYTQGHVLNNPFCLLPIKYCQQREVITALPTVLTKEGLSDHKYWYKHTLKGKMYNSDGESRPPFISPRLKERVCVFD